MTRDWFHLLNYETESRGERLNMETHETITVKALRGVSCLPLLPEQNNNSSTNRNNLWMKGKDADEGFWQRAARQKQKHRLCPDKLFRRCGQRRGVVCLSIFHSDIFILVLWLHLTAETGCYFPDWSLSKLHKWPRDRKGSAVIHCNHRGCFSRLLCV